jgi:chaperonin GroEL
MIEAKIIDPAKVVRCALQNAASVAAQVINSDVMLVEINPK